MKITEHTNAELELAFNHLQLTGRHLFLTGKAGTGKTTFLRSLKERLPKQMVVVAPTGVAAIHAGGVTIHSFFQIPFGPLVGRESGDSAQNHFRFSRDKIAMIRGMDLLVMDEISMVRADLLDAVDGVLRRYRDRRKPFGGVQLLMIGDLQQLAPVVKEDEEELLRAHYETPYFFGSRALRECDYACIELRQVYRQQEDRFLQLLNQVRENKLTPETLAELNRRHIPHFSPDDQAGYITLCTHNAQAQRLNETKLQEIAAPAVRFSAEIGGDFPAHSFPADPHLEIKVGAQIMFIKNDPSPDKKFYNGKIGRVIAVEEQALRVRCPGDSSDITVTPLQWDNIKYAIDPETNKIAESLEGTFKQIPLKLAWAITIHKSQGLTFERAIVEANASFAHGQVYVALSRCKTLEGLVLRTPLREGCIIVDPAVADYTRQMEARCPSPERLQSDRLSFQRELLVNLYSFHLLRYFLNQLLELADSNRSGLLPGLIETLATLHDVAQLDLVSVGEKFVLQMDRLLTEHPDAESNKDLHERLQKAVAYFEDKLQNQILDSLASAPIEVDNQDLQRQLTKIKERAENEARIKLACIQACAAGFHVQKFLAARSAATLKPNTPITPKKSRRKPSGQLPTPIAGAPPPDAPINPALFEALRQWRTEQATAQKVAAFCILHQKVLIAICAAAPKTLEDLSHISGLGPKKITTYGEAILALISKTQ